MRAFILLVLILYASVVALASHIPQATISPATETTVLSDVLLRSRRGLVVSTTACPEGYQSVRNICVPIGSDFEYNYGDYE